MTHPDLPPKGLMAKLARRQDRHSGQLVLPEGGLVASFLSGRLFPWFLPHSTKLAVSTDRKVNIYCHIAR